jgi:hypothetical protein
MDLTDKMCCQEAKQYSEEYDCFYCSTCDKWLEEKCGDEECDYCWGRPPKPSDHQPVPELGPKYLDRKL